MNDDFFNYLVATDELDDFLGYEPKCPIVVVNWRK